jgi:hypothetical protein
MEPLTQEQANELVRRLEQYLERLPAVQPAEPDDPDETAAEATARGWARQLLRAANANGHGGCRLCQG